MKKIDYSHIFRNKGGLGLDRHEPLPYSPFPGAASTRWRIQLQFEDRALYAGKPSSQAIGLAIKHCLATSEVAYLNVIDRVQKIAQFVIYANGEMECIQANQKLMLQLMPNAKTYKEYATTLRKAYRI